MSDEERPKPGSGRRPRLHLSLYEQDPTSATTQNARSTPQAVGANFRMANVHRPGSLPRLQPRLTL
jgi:hypothetical protein